MEQSEQGNRPDPTVTECDGTINELDEGYFRYVKFIRDPKGLIQAVVTKDNKNRPGPPPAEMEQLVNRANSIAQVIRTRFSHYPEDSKLVHEYDHWMRKLCATTRRGLLGLKPQTKAAAATLDTLEHSLIIAARPQRRKYVVSLFVAFLLTLASVLVITGLALFLDSRYSFICDDVERLLAIQAYTIIGLSFGVLFSGIVQNRVLTFKSLEHFDPDGFSTMERLLYVWVVATILEVFMYYGIVVLGIGGTPFNDVFASTDPAPPHLGILIGLITAISTELVANLIMRSAKPSNLKSQT